MTIDNENEETIVDPGQLGEQPEVKPTIEDTEVAEKSPFQPEADKLMEQLNLSEIWRLNDGRWYTNEAKANERNTSGDEIDHFKKSN